jgi:IS4 transposase
MATPKDGKKKEHDITMLKRTAARELRHGAPRGTKVMIVWDKAIIDYYLWNGMKNSFGVYFTTMEKSNSAAETCSENLVDRDDERNEGVLSAHRILTPGGVLLRRIVYVNPEDGVSYTYITSDMTLPPFLIVLLYKHRWDIEKIFYEFKSKLKERKSWASSPEAKKCHAVFECLAHNLLLLLEKRIECGEGITDEVEAKRKEGRVSKAVGDVKTVANTVNSSVLRATHRTHRFIRWVRIRIYKRVPWKKSVDRLRQVWLLAT